MPLRNKDSRRKTELTVSHLGFKLWRTRRRLTTLPGSRIRITKSGGDNWIRDYTRGNVGSHTPGCRQKVSQQHVDVRDIATINKTLADQRERHMGLDEKTVRAEDVHSDLPPEKGVDIRNMLRKHAHILSGQLGAEHHRDENRPGPRREAVQVTSLPCWPKDEGTWTRRNSKATEGRDPWTIYDIVSKNVVVLSKERWSVAHLYKLQELKSMTVKDTYPLPRMDECIDTLGDA